LKIHAAGSCEEYEMASHGFLQQAFPNGNKGQLHARHVQKRQLVGVWIVLAIGVAILMTPIPFSRIGIEQERRQFETFAAMLAREPKVSRETLDSLVALLKATASDCDAAVVCSGSLKENYLHARATLDAEISKQMVSGP
jgi:hypothetical protein